MKEIKLSPSKYGQFFTLVDDADFEWLNQWKWHVNKSRSNIYAGRIENKKTIFMHRIILGINDNPKIFSDHKDRNGLNNQRLNLRICTKAQNNSNRSSLSNSSSKYVGVSWDSDRKKWFSCICKNYKTIPLGRFDSEKEAALAYNEKAKELHGEFANLNQI